MENNSYILAELAKNNINLLHWDQKSNLLEFEYQWRVNDRMTKWSKAVTEGARTEYGGWGTLEMQGRLLLDIVKDIRSVVEK